MQEITMTITKADRADLEHILALQYLAYQSEAKLHNNYSIPPLLQTFDDIILEYEKCVFLKAVDESGTITGSIRGFEDQDTVHVQKVIVHPDKQGQGIGTALLGAIERECPSSRYEIFTSNKSVRNIRLYERLGYVRFKEQTISGELTFVYLQKCI